MTDNSQQTLDNRLRATTRAHLEHVVLSAGKLKTKGSPTGLLVFLFEMLQGFMEHSNIDGGGGKVYSSIQKVALLNI